MHVGIVGGGVHGAALAYYLRRGGADRVTLYEADSIAAGATGRSAGIVRFHYAHPTHVELVRQSANVLENFDEHIGGDSGFHRSGYLALYPPDDTATLREVVEVQRATGVDVTLLEPEELEAQFPAINAAGVGLAAHEPHGGYADPYLVATGYARAARRLGAVIKTQTPVLDLEREGARIVAIKTDDGREPVDFVVNAAGAAGDDVAAMAGVSVPLRLRESKVVTLSADRAYDLPVISDYSMEPDTYVKPEPSGDFAVGGIDRPWLDGDSLEGVTEPFLLEVGDRLNRRLSGFADASVVDSWSGRIAVTPDSNPVIGVPRNLENFFNIVGGSGHGFKTAPAVAESAAAMILDDEPSVDLSRYQLERFNTGDELTGISSKTYN
ncbi:MAG: NAD(P)/FAD-dependent oxidoreductase [Salinirussus sp.]